MARRLALMVSAGLGALINTRPEQWRLFFSRAAPEHLNLAAFGYSLGGQARFIRPMNISCRALCSGSRPPRVSRLRRARYMGLFLWVQIGAGIFSICAIKAMDNDAGMVLFILRSFCFVNGEPI